MSKMNLEPSQSYVSDAITTDDEDELPSSEINAPTTSSGKFILPEVDEKPSQSIKDISIDITVHDEKPDDVTVAAGNGTSVGATVQTESTAQAARAGPNGGMIVVNNDVTLETLLSRAQRGEVTLLAQAKEDGTYVLVENTQHDSEPVEAVSMQSADSQNATTADHIVINNDETQPKSIVTKNEAKIDTLETGQECSSAFDSKKKENDVDVLPDIPCDVTDQESDITEDAKVADNVEVMDSNNIPVTVDDEIYTEAKSKHAEGRQGKTISRSLQPIGHGTSPVAKRLRRHSSNEIQPDPNHAFTMKSEIKVIEPQEEIASDIVEPINEDCQDKNQTKIEEFSQDSEESSSKPTASLVEEPTQEKQPQKEQPQKEQPQKEQPQKEQPQLTLITSKPTDDIQDSIPKVVEESIPQPAEANSCHKCGKTYAPRAARFLKDHINKCK